MRLISNSNNALLSPRRLGGTIFANRLRANLGIYSPGLPAELEKALEQSVATIASIDPALRGGIVKAYVRSVDVTFLIGVPAGVLAGLSAM